MEHGVSQKGPEGREKEVRAPLNIELARNQGEKKTQDLVPSGGGIWIEFVISTYTATRFCEEKVLISILSCGKREDSESNPKAIGESCQIERQFPNQEKKKSTNEAKERNCGRTTSCFGRRDAQGRRS